MHDGTVYYRAVKYRRSFIVCGFYEQTPSISKAAGDVYFEVSTVLALQLHRDVIIDATRSIV